MEDFKLILYILAIVAYFIYTAWRKAFKTPDEDVAPKQERPKQERAIPKPMPGPVQRPQQQRPAAPATSFEDILREMQSKMERANEQAQQPVEVPRPISKPVPHQPYKERETVRVLSQENPDQARILNQRRRERRESDEALSEIKRQKLLPQTNVYAELLRNPQSARQAFIFTEIFNRKQY
ncbi:hypothetical protein [Pontibacter roseus]|uniref:hypothetical protein n=1 Tax=Pontibacter roseus TaxID=336989 RepID=UPI00036F227F|nr:hypothetical protein [Pontibacter roseus]